MMADGARGQGFFQDLTSSPPLRLVAVNFAVFSQLIHTASSVCLIKISPPLPQVALRISSVRRNLTSSPNDTGVLSSLLQDTDRHGVSVFPLSSI